MAIAIINAGGGVSDHGGLTGLSDDDHTQYLLVDGSRAMTGVLVMGGNAIRLTSDNRTQIYESGGSSDLYINTNYTQALRISSTSFVPSRNVVLGAGKNLDLQGGEVTIVEDNAANTPLTVKAAAAQTANLTEWQDSSAAIQFAIEADGDIRTSQASANTNTPSGATAYQLGIYNAAGTLLGYIPIYGSAW